MGAPGHVERGNTVDNALGYLASLKLREQHSQVEKRQSYTLKIRGLETGWR